MVDTNFFFRVRHFEYSGKIPLSEPESNIGWNSREHPNTILVWDDFTKKAVDASPEQVPWCTIEEGLSSGEWREVSLEEQLKQADRDTEKYPHLTNPSGGQPDLSDDELREIDQLIADKFMDGFFRPYSTNFFYSSVLQGNFLPAESTVGAPPSSVKFGGVTTTASTLSLSICLNALKLGGVDISK